MLGYFILFFLLGYFLYASIYTAIAAPFNTDQEAQQLAMIPMMLIIVGGIAVLPRGHEQPERRLALFFSLFPFTASLIMFLRTAVSPSRRRGRSCSRSSSCCSTTVGLAWFAGRIYRVGILMYGKKPTIPEIIRWVRYSPARRRSPRREQAHVGEKVGAELPRSAPVLTSASPFGPFV